MHFSVISLISDWVIFQDLSYKLVGYENKFTGSVISD